MNVEPDLPPCVTGLGASRGLLLAAWIERVGAYAAAATLRALYTDRCRWTGCNKTRVNRVWCAEHRDRSNRDNRDRAKARLADGLCRYCDTQRVGPSERYPDGDPAYCSKHRVAVDASNEKHAAKKKGATKP